VVERNDEQRRRWPRKGTPLTAASAPLLLPDINGVQSRNFRPPRHVARYDAAGEFADTVLPLAEVDEDQPHELKLPVKVLTAALRQLSNNCATREVQP
jgi:hypothetical protein